MRHLYSLLNTHSEIVHLARADKSNLRKLRFNPSIHARAARTMSRQVELSQSYGLTINH